MVAMRLDGRTRAWVERELGPGARVGRVRRMVGGVSSVVQEVTVHIDGTTRRVVLRRVVPVPEAEGHDPRAEAEREARSLAALDGRALAPRLLAADPAAEACAVPTVMTTRRPGRPMVAPRHPQQWIGEMAEAVRAVHAIGTAWSGLPDLTPWIHTPHPPPWSRRPEAWTQALAEISSRLPPGGPARLVHRDLHPGNILLHRGRLSGIVDWEQACCGPIEADISRCRVQVACLADRDAADDLLDQLADLSTAYDRRWDALVALELGPWAHDLLTFNRLGAELTLGGIRSTLDDLVIESMDG